jgi:hypothetical protein
VLQKNGNQQNWINHRLSNVTLKALIAQVVLGCMSGLGRSWFSNNHDDVNLHVDFIWDISCQKPADISLCRFANGYVHLIDDDN